MIICGACCVVLLFSLLAMKTLAAVTIFAVLFGFVSGACECLSESLWCIDDTTDFPLWSCLCNESDSCVFVWNSPGDGVRSIYIFRKTACERWLTLFSARMGFALLFTGLAGLIGPPINGALLTSEYKWWRPIVFSGVRWHDLVPLKAVLSFLFLLDTQVISASSLCAFIVLRILLWRKSGKLIN